MAMGSVFKSPYIYALGGIEAVTSQGEAWGWEWTTREPRSFEPRARERDVWVQGGHEESIDPYEDTTP